MQKSSIKNRSSLLKDNNENINIVDMEEEDNESASPIYINK